MATQIISRNDTTANWTSNNPILGKGEIGVEFLVDSSIKTKIGDGVTHWLSLPYNTIGRQGDKGDKGDTGTGLSRTLSTTIDFTTISGELQYVEKTITDAAILSTSIILIQVTDSDFVAQNVQCGVVSISEGVNYTIYAMAPDGATGSMSINILIF
jgi:hypothetical protein